MGGALLAWPCAHNKPRGAAKETGTGGAEGRVRRHVPPPPAQHG
uniref:Uncharacterized protein n=1 Tax=Arundo donax TaxID=35708 RepID=A0A0A8XSU9_ARUDO